MASSSNLPVGAGVTNAFNKVNNWMKTLLPSQQSPSSSDSILLENTRKTDVNQPFVFRSWSAPAAVQQRTDRPHFNRLKQACMSAFGEQMHSQQAQSFRRSNVLKRTSSNTPSDKCSDKDSDLISLTYSSCGRKSSQVALTFRERTDSVDAGYMTVTSDDPPVPHTDGNRRISVTIRSPTKQNVEIFTYDDLNGRKISVSKDDTDFHLQYRQVPSQERGDDLDDALNNSIFQAGCKRNSSKGNDTDCDTVGRVKLSLQYFGKSKQLRVLLLQVKDLPKSKNKVYAKVCLMKGQTVLEKRRGKITKVGGETFINDDMHFKNIEELDLYEIVLRMGLYTKRSCLRKSKLIGCLEIPLSGYDVTKDVMLWGSLRSEASPSSSQTEPILRNDLKVIFQGSDTASSNSISPHNGSFYGRRRSSRRKPLNCVF